MHFAAELKDFDPTVWMDRKQARRMDRFAQMVVAASRQAEADSGVDIAKESPRIGASIATGIGGLGAFQDCYQTLMDRGPDRVNPFSIPAIIPNMGAGWVSMELGTQRPALVPVHRLRRLEHGDRRRRGRDPARARRRDVLRRHRGRDHARRHRRLRRDARALAPERRSEGRLAAVRRRPRRLRDGRGRRRRRAGGARAREGARREDLRGADRLRRLLGRESHHRAGPGRGRTRRGR